MERLFVIEAILQTAYRLNHETLPKGDPYKAEVKAWEYALEDIPTHHLDTCFRRAVKNKRDPYILKAVAVTREWDDLKVELRLEATAHSQQTDRQLRAGQGSLGLMGILEWKSRHNLLADWKLGDPFPPESDLYNKPVPQPRGERAQYAGQAEAKWYVSEKNAYELYPKPDAPDTRHIRTESGQSLEFAWWVERCTGYECNGWLAEHTGPGGQWVDYTPCLSHRNSSTPKPPRYNAAEYVRAKSEQDRVTIDPQEDAYIRAKLAEQIETQTGGLDTDPLFVEYDQDDIDIPF